MNKPIGQSEFKTAAVMKKTLVLLSLILAACSQDVSSPAESVIPERWQDTNEKYKFSSGIRAGNFLYLSGIVTPAPKEGETLEDVYERTFDSIESVLTEGGASWDNVIALETYHMDIPAQIDAFIAVKNRHMTEKPYPTWTALDVDRFFPDQGISEIKVTAYLGGK